MRPGRADQVGAVPWEAGALRGVCSKCFVSAFWSGVDPTRLQSLTSGARHTRTRTFGFITCIVWDFGLSWWWVGRRRQVDVIDVLVRVHGQLLVECRVRVEAPRLCVLHVVRVLVVVTESEAGRRVQRQREGGQVPDRTRHLHGASSVRSASDTESFLHPSQAENK